MRSHGVVSFVFFVMLTLCICPHGYLLRECVLFACIDKVLIAAVANDDDDDDDDGNGPPFRRSAIPKVRHSEGPPLRRSCPPFRSEANLTGKAVSPYTQG